MQKRIQKRGKRFERAKDVLRRATVLSKTIAAMHPDSEGRLAVLREQAATARGEFERLQAIEREVQDHFRMTRRDLMILERVAEFRFLTSEQIMRLVPALSGETAKQIPERLKRLWLLQYLDRPRAQLQYYRAGGGSDKLVYALGNEGAKLLSERSGIPIHKLNWTLKNNRVGQLNIQHTVNIAEMLSKAESECAGRTDIGFIKSAQLTTESPIATQKMEKPHKIAGTVNFAGRTFKLAIHPDAVFALEFKTEDERSHFFYEDDRGTMPVARKLSSMRADVRQRSLLEKFLCYAQGWKDGHVQTRYGWDHFRVIVMTTSPERVERMVDVAQEVAKDRNLAGCRGLFLFGETASFSQSSLLQYTFINGKGEQVKLTD